MILSPEVIFMLICLAASLVLVFQRSAEFYLKLFPIYLSITMAVGIISANLASKGKPNIVLYNLFSIFEFVFYFFILKSIIKNKKAKKTVNVIIIAYPMLAALNLIFLQRGVAFHSMSYTLGCLLVIALCILYFIDVFQNPETTSLLKLPAFWICTAITFSYCCTFPFFAMINFFKQLPPIVGRNLHTIMALINIFSSILLTVAFICRIRIPRSTSSS
ncbi:MAG TPA: hypothetical protein VG890_11390 [Puia sp.]|nr:hypothetical protein [Puia sp.]